MSKRKTHEQYIDEVAKINPNIEVLGEYVYSSTNILHKCNVCGREWLAKPNNILQGRGCPTCATLYSNKKRTKTHKQYVTEVAEINPNIEVIGKYINSSSKITHRCKIDGWEWDVVPSSILGGHGCPKCASINGTKKRTKTHEQYVAEVYDVNPNIEVVGKYIDNATKILHRCKNGHEWETAPTVILSGHGCPKCVGVKKRRTKNMSND